jgi:hypothetical protein
MGLQEVLVKVGSGCRKRFGIRNPNKEEFNMRKRLLAAAGAVAMLAGLSASSAVAAPPERATDPFVCPVLTVNENAVDHTDGQFNKIGDGQYTFGPGAAGSPETFNGNVPNHATNGGGEGSPGGTHSAPGDTDYTAIWSGN